MDVGLFGCAVAAPIIWNSNNHNDYKVMCASQMILSVYSFYLSIY